MQVIDMCCVDEAMHGGIDGGRGATSPVQAVVEGGDHLVLAFDARVDAGEASQPIKPEDRQSVLGQGPEVATRALDPQQFDRRARRWVDDGPLGGRVAAGVVGIACVGTQPVGPAEELVHG